MAPSFDDRMSKYLSQSTASRGGGNSAFDKRMQEILKDPSAVHRLPSGNVVDNLPAARPKSHHGGGFLGAIGKVLNVIDLPRSAVTSTINEAADVLSGNDGFSGKDWWSNFVNHVSSSEYMGQGTPNSRVHGTHRKTELGNRGGRGGLGLLFDIGLDPLTYVSLGGAAVAEQTGKNLGRAGAEVVGRRIAEKEAAGEITTEVAKDLAARAGRARGVAGLTGAELDKLGLKGGTRFAGKEVISHDLTRKLTGPVRETLAGVRDVSDKAITRIAGEETNVALKAAYRSGDPEKALTAIRTLRERTTELARHEVRNADWQKQIAKVLRHTSADEADSITRALGGDAEALARVNPEKFEAVRGLYDSIRDAANTEVGDNFIKHLDDYVNFVRTSEAAEKLGPSKIRRAAHGLPKVTEEFTRKYKVGEEFLGVTIKTGTPHEFNEIIAKTIDPAHAVQLYETDIRKLLPVYAQGVSKGVANHKLDAAMRAAGDVVERLPKGKVVAKAAKADERLAAAEEKLSALAEARQLASRVDLPSEPQNGAIQGLEGVSKGITPEASVAAAVDPSVREAVRASDDELRTLLNAHQILSEDLRTGRVPYGPQRDSVAQQLDEARTRLEARGITDHSPQSIQRELKAVRQRIADTTPPEEIFDQAAVAVAKASDDPVDQVRALEDQARVAEAAAEADVAKAQKKWEKAHIALADPKNRETITDMMTQGMVPWGKNGKTPEWLAEAMAATAKATEGANYGKFWKTYDAVHNVIKGYLIATPGFHFRNLFGGMWNNFLAGMNPASYFAFIKALKTGDDEIAREVLENIPLGGQVATETTKGLTGSTLSKFNPASPDNALFGFSRKIGNEGKYSVETILRGSLAYDVRKRGGTMADALDAVYRHHFNYADLSQFERKFVKRVVPFYTFTRRNLPLQIEALLTNPGKFTAYLHVKQNIEPLSEGEDVVPQYFGDLGAIRLPFHSGGAQAYVAPTLPLNDLFEYLPSSSPSRSIQKLGGQISPLLRVPVEEALGTQFFQGRQLSDKYTKVPAAWDVIRVPGTQTGLAALLSKVGWTEKGRDGYYVSEKNAYVVENYLPLLSRTRRMLPSEEKYQARGFTTWFNFLTGVGLHLNTKYEQGAEMRRRQFSDQQTQRRLKDLGF
jgi:hypothetical protein